MVLLVFGTGSIVYFASTVTAFIIEGDLRNVRFASRLKKRMKRMTDHVVVCGAGPGATLREARVRERFGMTVLAVRGRDSQSWIYNPDADERLGSGMTLVVLGSAEQVAELRRLAA